MQQAITILFGFLATIGGAALIGGSFILYMWWKHPTNLEIMISQIARVVSFFWSGAKKIKIKYELQGKLNKEIQEFNPLGRGTAPYGISIEWIPEGSERASFLRGDTVVARMSYNHNPGLNYLNAALLYVRSGFLPRSKPYMSAKMRRATDLLGVGMILSKSGNNAAQRLYYEGILQEELDLDDELSLIYNSMQDMETYGLFSQVFIPEVIDYPISVQGSEPRSRHKEELAIFLEFLTSLAQAAESRAITDLDFSHSNINLGVVYVGIREKLNQNGARPYLGALQHCVRNGADTVYFIARGASVQAVRAISNAAQAQGMCSIVDTHVFTCPIPETGQRVPAIICRVSTHVGAS